MSGNDFMSDKGCIVRMPFSRFNGLIGVLFAIFRQGQMLADSSGDVGHAWKVFPEYLLLSRKMGETSLGVIEGGSKASGGGYYNQNSTLKNKSRK